MREQHIRAYTKVQKAGSSRRFDRNLNFDLAGVLEMLCVTELLATSSRAFEFSVVLIVSARLWPVPKVTK